jgi:DNA-binding MarR family transcriptional regulator
MLKKIFTDIIGNAIVGAGRSIKVHHLEKFAENGFEITPEQYLVLNILSDKETFTQNKLCKLLFKDKSNMARLISVLEENGFVEKHTDPESKKTSNIITITNKGKEIRAKITPIMHNSRKSYLKDISQDDMYTCIKVLSQIQKNLEKE